MMKKRRKIDVIDKLCSVESGGPLPCPGVCWLARWNKASGEWGADGSIGNERTNYDKGRTEPQGTDTT